MNDPVPGLTVYAITMAQARELPGPAQQEAQLRHSLHNRLTITPGLASRVRSVRRARRMNLSTLAARASIHVMTLALIEEGHHVPNERQMIERLANALLVSQDALRGHEAIPPMDIYVAPLPGEVVELEARYAQAA